MTKKRARRAKKNVNDPVVFDWDTLNRFPGIFHLGSEGEKALLQHRHRDDKSMVRHSGPLVEFGLIQSEFYPAWSANIPSHSQSNKLISTAHDVATMVEIDYRLRWCRCLLDSLNLPYDREEVLINAMGDKTAWSYASELDEASKENYRAADPLEIVMLMQSPFSPAWYAAKILSHNRRAESFEKIKPPLEEFSVAREWMLFGETWAEAKFITNHSSVTISGRRQRRGSKAGGDMRSGKLAPNTAAILAKMESLVSGHGVKRAAEIAHRHGLGTSPESNRKLWQRHKK